MNKALGFGLIALVAGAVGFYANRVFQGPVEMVTPPAPAAIAQVLPEFTLMNREGAPQSIKAWLGKSMIVNFWATWCEPCRREIPLLKALHRARSSEGFQIVGVAVDFREAVLKYANEMDIDYPLLMGEQDALETVQAFGVAAVGLPFTVFTDKQGRIINLHLGELTAPQAEVILSTIGRVNAGELTPAQARTTVAEQLAEHPHGDENTT